MLMGTYEHRLDSKSRLVLPAKIREKLGDVVFVTLGLEKCVSLYSEVEWEIFSAKVRNLAFYSNPQHRGFARAVISSAHEMPIDGTGRVLLPTILREHAGLGQEVMICGVNDHAEVWDKERWETIYKPRLDNLSDLAEDLGF